MKLGIGITLCPEISIRNEIKTGELIKLEWDTTETETSVIMITHAQKWRSPLLDQFIIIAEEEMSG